MEAFPQDFWHFSRAKERVEELREDKCIEQMDLLAYFVAYIYITTRPQCLMTFIIRVLV